MSTSVRSIFSHAAIFGLAPILQKLIAALLLPYFTHYLDQSEYGLRDLLVTVTGLFPVLFALEYRVAFLKRYTRLQDKRERLHLAARSFHLFSLMAILAASGFYLSWPLLHLLFPAAEISSTFRLVLALGILFDILLLILLATAQAELLSSKMVVINLIQFTLGVLLNIYFVVFRDLGPLGLFLGNTIASGTAALLLLYWQRQVLAFRPSLRATLQTLRPELSYCVPLWGGALLYFTLQNVDRLVLSNSLAALGVYGMARKLSHYVVLLVLVPFQRSFDVWRFRIHESGEDPAVLARVFRLFLLVASFASLGIATLGGDLFTWLADDAYRGARSYLPWLSLAMLLQCAYAVTNSAFYVQEKTGIWVLLFAAGTLLQTLGCALAVTFVGASAIPLALIASNAFLYGASIRYGARLWPVPYEHGKAIALMLLTTALALTRTFFDLTPLPAFLLDISLLGALLLASLGAGLVRVSEITSALAIVHARITKRGRR